MTWREQSVSQLAALVEQIVFVDLSINTVADFITIITIIVIICFSTACSSSVTVLS